MFWRHLSSSIYCYLYTQFIKGIAELSENFVKMLKSSFYCSLSKIRIQHPIVIVKDFRQFVGLFIISPRYILLKRALSRFTRTNDPNQRFHLVLRKSYDHFVNHCPIRKLSSHLLTVN
jgi:hypothetical protein